MKYKTVSTLAIILCALVLTTLARPRLAGQQASEPACGIDMSLAEQYFREAEAASRSDAGRLWGAELYGPLMFVDRVTRTIAANRADAEGRLRRQGNIFVGKLPDEENIANTATRWAGVEWTMVVWPLPTDKTARVRLMAHEMFHRVQDEIGLAGANPSNGHLDSIEGRVWLQMEWRALSRALAARGAGAKSAIEDALVFRLHRRAVFAGADATERGLEMNEGLSEYTGVKLQGTTRAESVAYLVKALEAFERRPTFVRSFAYASGPAYGLLLDRANPQWRKGLKSSDDLGAMAQRLYSIRIPKDLARQAERRAARYDCTSLRAAETARESGRRERLSSYRARFVDGPVLILPLTEQVNYSFNPNNLESLDGVGTVYPTLRVTDAWGVLEVTGGALMFRDGTRVSKVHVVAPRELSAKKVEGDGWTLELKDGWALEPSARAGDYIIRKTAQ
jgi:hypothetical protein